MVFLATLDHEHRPTVSYKGGDPGFLKVPDPRAVPFPSYDGNGMYLYHGQHRQAGPGRQLFIDFEVPRRLRLQGVASLSDDPALTGLWKEAELAIRVSATGLWANCPRYVHRYRKIKASRHVPRHDGDTPFAGWKGIDTMSAVLNEQERAEAERLGPITEAEWVAMVDAGDEDARKALAFLEVLRSDVAGRCIIACRPLGRGNRRVAAPGGVVCPDRGYYGVPQVHGNPGNTTAEGSTAKLSPSRGRCDARLGGCRVSTATTLQGHPAAGRG